LILPTRKFVREGALRPVLADGTTATEFFFLFNDQLVRTVARKKKIFNIPTVSTLTRSSSSTSKGNQSRVNLSTIPKGSLKIFEIIDITQLEVAEVEKWEVNEDCLKLTFHIVHRQSKDTRSKTTVMADTQEEKEGWINDINSLIKENTSPEEDNLTPNSNRSRPMSTRLKPLTHI